MNRDFHINIVFVVAVHMLFGCCFHHAHAYGSSFAAQALTVEASCSCRHESAGSGQSCDYPSQRQPFDGGRCVFARRDFNDDSDGALGCGCLNPVYVSAGVPTFGGIDGVDSSLGELGTPIPLHLLNQVFLL